MFPVLGHGFTLVVKNDIKIPKERSGWPAVIEHRTLPEASSYSSERCDRWIVYVGNSFLEAEIKRCNANLTLIERKVMAFVRSGEILNCDQIVLNAIYTR